MANNGYFNIERDLEIEKVGGFFCQACVVSKPASELSADPRYCLGCYEVLNHEPQTPENATEENHQNTPQTQPVSKEPVAKILQGELWGEGIMRQPKTRGRPQKAGEVHRSTLWRREKQKEV